MGCQNFPKSIVLMEKAVQMLLNRRTTGLGNLFEVILRALAKRALRYPQCIPEQKIPYKPVGAGSGSLHKPEISLKPLFSSVHSTLFQQLTFLVQKCNSVIPDFLSKNMILHRNTGFINLAPGSGWDQAGGNFFHCHAVMELINMERLPKYCPSRSSG